MLRPCYPPFGDRKAKKYFTTKEAESIGKKLGITW